MYHFEIIAMVWSYTINIFKSMPKIKASTMASNFYFMYFYGIIEGIKYILQYYCWWIILYPLFMSTLPE